MSYCWKTEYYVYEGDDAVAWFDHLDQAKANVATNPDATHIDKVKHYQDDSETVWEKGA